MQDRVDARKEDFLECRYLKTVLVSLFWMSCKTGPLISICLGKGKLTRAG